MTNTDNTTIIMMRIPMISAADEAEATPTMTSIATVASAGITKTYIARCASHVIMKACTIIIL
jgi:CTP synthase (UTP-ammonia lyase)